MQIKESVAKYNKHCAFLDCHHGTVIVVVPACTQTQLLLCAKGALWVVKPQHFSLRRKRHNLRLGMDPEPTKTRLHLECCMETLTPGNSYEEQPPRAPQLQVPLPQRASNTGVPHLDRQAPVVDIYIWPPRAMATTTWSNLS